MTVSLARNLPRSKNSNFASSIRAASIRAAFSVQFEHTDRFVYLAVVQLPSHAVCFGFRYLRLTHSSSLEEGEEESGDIVLKPMQKDVFTHCRDEACE